jgi:hypothetical protein
MTKYLEMQNPYNYPQMDWYLHNNITYLCHILNQEANFPIELTDAFYSVYKSGETTAERELRIFEILLEIGINKPEKLDAPANGFADILDSVPLENMGKTAYLLLNPNDQDVPANFNAFNYPEFFPSAVTEDATEYQSMDTYNEVLKKALDSRNNSLDARKFNQGLTADEIVNLANQNLAKSYIEESEILPIEEESQTQETTEVLELRENNTTTKINTLLESKNRIVTQKPMFNVNDLLESTDKKE